jgi:2-succinyl-6-hydroxy-2,4-cyclohexadiene-1-carboxylate synthase
MTRIATRDGVAYAIHDSGRGPVLVLLHGFAADSRTWDALAGGLGAGRRLFAVDLLGHGGSDAPLAARHAVERQVEDLAWLIEGLCPEPVDVLGYSFGARIALWLAVTTPRLVRRLVLESPSAGIADAGGRVARVAADERWAALLDEGDLAAFHEAWEAQPVFATRSTLPEETRASIREQHLTASAHGLAASLRGAGHGAMPPLDDQLGSVVAPTLVLAGALDPIGHDRATEVAAGIPGARLEVLPGTGHAPHLERPDEALRLIDAFLNDQPSPSTRGAP